MKRFVYKSREEELLIKKLSKSQLISESQLLEIKKLYLQKVPYHNFIHALKVAEWVLKLPKEKYNIIEIKSLFISALFHDAWHKGIASDLDEFRSLDMAFEGIMNFEQKYDYSWIDYSIVRKSIMGTVFKNRGKNTDMYAVLLADLDVSTIWMSFLEFLYYCDIPISLEFWVKEDRWLKDVNYFKFLMNIEKNIFRAADMQKLFPDSLKNIKTYLDFDVQIMKKLVNYWKENDITYEEFKSFYEKNI